MQRQLIAKAEGARRWDRAYQQLLPAHLRHWSFEAPDFDEALSDDELKRYRDTNPTRASILSGSLEAPQKTVYSRFTHRREHLHEYIEFQTLSHRPADTSGRPRFSPKAHLTAIIDVWNSYYIDRAKAAMDGSWESGDTWGGFKDGMVKMADYNPAIPEDVMAMAKQAEADIASGKLHPFAGPIKDQSGKLVVLEGEVLDDEKLLAMDWYVEGVQGTLPK